MDEDDVRVFERLACAVEAIGAAIVDQSRAIEALALALRAQGRQGTLRIKIEAPQSKLKGRRRRLKAAVAAKGGDHHGS